MPSVMAERNFEAWKRARRRNGVHPVRGHVASADGLKHWRHSASPGSPGVRTDPQSIPSTPEEWGLEPLKPVEPSKKYDLLLDALVSETMKNKARLGYPVLPQSVLDKVVGESWRLGQPIKREWLEDYTKRLLEQEDRKQGRVTHLKERNHG